VQIFDKDFSKMLNNHDCDLLMPWKGFLPLCVPKLLIAYFISSQAKQSTTLDTGFHDYFGIFMEMNCLNILIPCGLICYYVYAGLYMDSNKMYHLDLFPPEYIFICLPLLYVCFTVILPVLKILVASKKSRKIHPDINREPISGSSETPSPFQNITKILQDPKALEQFRDHAKKSLCSENVDFCVAVLAFKNQQPIFDRKSSQVISMKFLQHNEEKTHQVCVQILNDFVANRAPFEVNLSSAQKTRILQFSDFETFCLLEPSRRFAIFDEAENEILKLLTENLLKTFHQNYKNKPANKVTVNFWARC